MKEDWKAKIEKMQARAEAQRIEEEAEILENQNVGYTSKMLVQAAFPYRKVESNTYELTAGNITVSVSSSKGVPYGKYPRLIMAYLITRAVENAWKVQEGEMTIEQARRISLGHSLSSFLDAIGISGRSGGSNGNIRALRDQMNRLMHSMITISSDDGNRTRGKNTVIADTWDLWFDVNQPDQTTIQTSELVLTREFFEHITSNPIPIDMDILRALSRPRAMDMYLWVTLKQYWLEKAGHDHYTFDWATIGQHFSPRELTTARQLADFRTEIRKSVEDIVEAWPDCGVKCIPEGVSIAKTAPSVAIRPARPRI